MSPLKLRHSIDTLLHRRQFLLGREDPLILPQWPRVDCGGGLCLAAHGDLTVVQVGRDRQRVTILGEILDPSDSNAGNDDIAAELLRTLERGADWNALIETTFRFGGRWIVIAVSGGEARLVHDAAGTKQVYYTDTRSSAKLPLWCASQPGLLAELLGLATDPEVDALMQSEVFRREPQYWWPGDSSPISEVRLLLPNHYLDLNSGRPHRYWPTRSRTPVSLGEAVERCSGILRGTVLAASKRYPLTLPITAGFDSRVVLAAARPIAHELNYYTFVFKKYLNSNHPDVIVPRRLLRRLGLEHHVIRCRNKRDRSWTQIYRRNHVAAANHDDWATISQGLYEHQPDGLLRMTATVSEIARCFYSKACRGKSLSARTLSGITGLGSSAFVISHFERWLERLPEGYGYDPLDLFYWEQRAGSWAAMNFQEWDIVQDVFSPFNCRELLVTMLAVEEQYRRPPAHVLHTRIMGHLWPQLLGEPLNPPPRRRNPKSRVRQQPKNWSTVWRWVLSGHPRRAWRQVRVLQQLRKPSGPLRLHLGCGRRRLDGFLNIDMNYSNATDYVSDICQLPCRDNSVERIENYHVIENIPHPEALGALAEWFRVLVPNGVMVIECADFDEGIRQYIEGNESRLYSVYGPQRFAGDVRYCGYNAKRLRDLLVAAGFIDIVQTEPQDCHKDSEPCLRMECRKR